MRIRRKTKRRIRRILLLTPLVLGAAFLYMVLRHPSTAHPSSIRVEMSEERVKRGRYIFTALANCDRCHSQRDFSHLYAPVIEATRGAGRVLDQENLPGKIVAPNVTPDEETGIGLWTDGEKIRAIREGIDRSGKALHPLMPYQNYRVMSDDDVESLVAYLNSLPPVRNPLPKTSLSLWTSVAIKSDPKPVDRSIPQPDPGGGEVYGEYLATIAGCEGCHTPEKGGKPDPSLRYAGGRFFKTNRGQVYSMNITSDRATGIGSWTFNRFAEQLRLYRQYNLTGLPVVGPDRFTLMPYEAYARLTDEDVEALFLYFKAMKPVIHKVVAHPEWQTTGE